MRWRPLPAALAPAVLVGACALGGCGSSTDQQPAAQAPAGPTDSGPTDSGPTGSTTDPAGTTSAAPAPAGGSSCATAAPAALVRSVLGAPVAGPRESPTSDGSMCSYNTTVNGKPVGLNIRLASPFNPDVFPQEKKALQSQGYTVADLPGVGTQAYSATGSGSSTPNVVGAYRGSVEVYLIAPISVDQAKTLVQKVLANV